MSSKKQSVGKSKSEAKVLQETESESKQRQGQNTVQVLISKVTEKLDLRQNLRSMLLLIALTGAAVAGRAALQNVPSVETVTPFAILSGFILGPVYGFVTGASAFYASNFVVWGGQGPWTIFQCLGAGMAGFVAGLFGKTWKNFKMYMLATAAGIFIYEAVINISMGVMWSGIAGLPFFILTSLPFSAVHLVSSLGICAGLWKAKNVLPKLGGKIYEKTKLLLSGHSRSGDSSVGRMHPELAEHEIGVVHPDNRREPVSRLRWRKRGNSSTAA